MCSFVLGLFHCAIFLMFLLSFCHESAMNVFDSPLHHILSNAQCVWHLAPDPEQYHTHCPHLLVHHVCMCVYLCVCVQHVGLCKR